MSTQATKVLSIIGLIILGVILFLGGMFYGRAQTSAAFYPGSMMFGNSGYAPGDNYGANMMGDYTGDPGNYGGMMGSYGNMPGGFGGMMGNFGNMPGGYGGMMGGYNNMPGGFGGMTGNFGDMAGFGSMMGSGMMGGLGLTTADPLTIEEAQTAVNDYLASLNNDNLTLGEVMIFDNQAYAQVMDKSSGDGAFEVLVDPVTGNVFPEPGPNMMWNSEYSPMAGMMGAGMMGGGNMMGSFGFTPGGDATVTAEEAVSISQEYLDTALPGTVASDDVTAFPGYYTLHIEQDGEIIGMMSVNAVTGDVFPHFWHGEFITMSEHE